MANIAVYTETSQQNTRPKCPLITMRLRITQVVL